MSDGRSDLRAGKLQLNKIKNPSRGPDLDITINCQISHEKTRDCFYCFYVFLQVLLFD